MKTSREDAELRACLLAFSGGPLAVCTTRVVNMTLQDESILLDVGIFFVIGIKDFKDC